MINVIAWNIRGAVGARGQRRVKELISSFHPSIIAVFETHCQFERAQTFWQGVGYKLVCASEAAGHSGGIWVLTPISSPLTIEALDAHSHIVTVSVRRGYGKWLCSLVYASPNPSRREELWGYLRTLRQRFLDPWVTLGDFNEVCSPEEVVDGDFSDNRALRMLGGLRVY